MVVESGPETSLEDQPKGRRSERLGKRFDGVLTRKV